METLIPSLHLATTAALFGLIWTIQLVHYPAFAFVATDKWTEFHTLHTRKITLIVFPLMMAELAIACVNLSSFPALPLLLISLIPIIQWLLTAFIFIPLHNKLSHSNDPALVKKLVRFNWTRTLLWSVELAAIGAYLIKTKSP